MSNLLVEQSNSVTTLTLNRVEVSNAFDEELIHTLTHTLYELSRDVSQRIIVIQANGKHFCAGADLDWMKRSATFSERENITDAKALAMLMKTLNDMPQPTVAKVHGAVYGGAIGLLASCDIVIADSNARFCLSEVKLGLVPAVIAPYVIRAIGMRATKRFALSAEVFSADIARDLGLVHEVINDNSLDDAVNDMVKRLLTNAPNALAITKELLSELEPLKNDILDQTAETIAAVRASEEAQEGLDAFFNKRKPAWVNE